MFNVISTDLMRDFSLHATNLGKMSAYYFYANLLFLPIAGALLRSIFYAFNYFMSALLLCVLGTTGFAITHSFLLACIFRFMSGIGSAFCFLSSIRLASRWFPAKKMALITGLIVTMAMLGGMVAQTPLAVLAQSLGWRDTLLIDASFGVLIFIIIFYCVQDCPTGLKQSQKISQRELAHLGLVKSWRLAYSNPQNLLCGLYTALINLPIALLGAIWGSLFLQQTAHFSVTEASLAPSFHFFLEQSSGSYGGGIYGQKYRNVRRDDDVRCDYLFLFIKHYDYMSALTTFLYSRFVLLFFTLGFFYQ